MLKAKTRCHHCKRLGHWKRECPNLQTKGAGRSTGGKTPGSSSSAKRGTEALVIEENDGGSADVYLTEDVEMRHQTGEVTWQEQASVAVQYSGFADTHATGNRQRQADGVSVVHEISEQSPAQAILADYWAVDRQRKVLRRVHVVPMVSLFRFLKDPIQVEIANSRLTTMNLEDGSTQKIQGNSKSDRRMAQRWTGCAEFPMLDGVSVPEVLSADVVGSTDSSLAVCGVPDTAV